MQMLKATCFPALRRKLLIQKQRVWQVGSSYSSKHANGLDQAPEKLII
jgi:hypothetical protein